jgi:hypothetical protein
MPPRRAGASRTRRLGGRQAAVAQIHSEGHDAIVEPFLNGSDVEVPVITIDGEPTILPMMLFEQADPDAPSHLLREARPRRPGAEIPARAVRQVGPDAADREYTR